MPILHLTPSDQLFFRDARPMETGAGTGGYGVHWPNPAILFGALHAALHRSGIAPCEERTSHGHSYRFTSLKTAGPFPCKPCPCCTAPQCYFPIPSDLVASGETQMQRLQPIHPYNHGSPPAHSHLNAHRLSPLHSPAKPSKSKLPHWLSKPGVEAYLRNHTPGLEAFALYNSDLYDTEWTTGIGTSNTTGAQDGERIYSAQYMRLRDTVSLVMHATLQDKQQQEHLYELFSTENTILTGGQQRPCRVQTENSDDLSPLLPLSIGVGECQKHQGQYLVSWLLLSPAVYPCIGDHHGGWLPNWVDHASKKVLLRIIRQQERAKRRKSKNARNRGTENLHIPDDSSSLNIGATLVAASIKGSQAITSWRDHTTPNQGWGPKPTHLAVPAGSVYYFTCDSKEDASRLIQALSWHNDQGVLNNRRSTNFGEKGFGLGVCGTWHPHQL